MGNLHGGSSDMNYDRWREEQNLPADFPLVGQYLHYLVDAGLVTPDEKQRALNLYIREALDIDDALTLATGANFNSSILV